MSQLLQNISQTPLTQTTPEMVFAFLQERYQLASQHKDFNAAQFKTPEQYFRGQADLDYLQGAIERCPDYQPQDGAPAKEHLFTVQAVVCMYPTPRIDNLTGETIETFMDMVDACSRLATYWAEGQNPEWDAEERRRKMNRDAQQRFRDKNKGVQHDPTKRDRVNAAKEALQKAIDGKNAAIRDWDIYIAQKKYEYEQARL